MANTEHSSTAAWSKTALSTCTARECSAVLSAVSLSHARWPALRGGEACLRRLRAPPRSAFVTYVTK